MTRRTVTVSLDDEIIDQLDALAYLEGVKRHVVVRRLLLDRLERVVAEHPEVEQLGMLRPVEGRRTTPARGGLTVIDGGAS